MSNLPVLSIPPPVSVSKGGRPRDTALDLFTKFWGRYSLAPVTRAIPEDELPDDPQLSVCWVYNGNTDVDSGYGKQYISPKKDGVPVKQLGAHVLSYLLSRRYPELVRCRIPEQAVALMECVGDEELTRVREDLRMKRLAVPEPLVVDHVASLDCMHVTCGRPYHLEAVTHLVNLRRSQEPVKGPLKRQAEELEVLASERRIHALVQSSPSAEEERWANLRRRSS